MPQYEINAPHVVGEVIDGEAIIMDLKSGHYYSCTNIGAAIWRGVEARADIDTLTSLLCARFPDFITEISADVTAFIAQLLEYRLIRLAVAGPEADSNPLDGVGSYIRPELQAYTDMEALLLLDPIHEVDEAGWPTEAKA